ncbi:hypothetical protein [Mycobacteroides abscessus]|uniref:hypothetical protein n=1 Tax=Mycobacteroides abscessus TaxID=36809 RepID=UPI0009265B9F|nr:hypothetical protein [Mycobacteroides abscessus]PVB44305.1 hypothetical protein DDJ39_15235 [Mycobacteroides abscessus]SHS37589.1 Uncharacterised protein [Mycobacteroides abscessus subsp. abscessus]SHS53217.1 Uncharacterised protein [Mycobacteroides abscessus subsp. abscessus]SHS85443.1 Uncharacterised protein [Mycobacteroides abscessus subsp. abscessus]SHT06113.1 Uncharacterised protein [Mycobacteroides abscessus subsp. abscessus]
MITVGTCAYSWCVNDTAKHVEHWGGGETTADLDGPKSVAISCAAMVTDNGTVYPDEIVMCIRSVSEGAYTAATVGEGIGLALTVEEAQQLRDLLDVAMTNREEIRGRIG